MNKELYVSSSPHETKVAMLEDDSLAEVYFERENEYTLAGSIYKGRVTRVLPGMQSAFVDIGLERDAFLYVSDFLDLQDEEDEEFGDVKVTGQTLAQANGFVVANEEPAEDTEEDEAEEEEASDTQAAAPSNTEADDAAGRRWRGRRRRRGRRGGRERIASERGPQEGSAETEAEAVTESEVEQELEAEAGEEPVVELESEETAAAAPSPAADAYTPMLLPGESIARYQAGYVPPEPSSDEPPVRESSSRDGRRGRGREDRWGRGRDRDRGRGRGRERDREREPREARGPEAPLPANYTPIVLPGESISKYRGVEPTAPTESEPQATPFLSQEEIQNEAYAETAAAVPTIVPAEPGQVAEPIGAQPADEEPTAAEASVEAPRLAHYIYRDEAEQEGVVEEEVQEEAEEPAPVAEVPVKEPAAEPTPVVEAEAIEAKAEPQVEEVIEEAEEEEEPIAEEFQQATHEAGHYSPEGGQVEHEEMDDEESDMPSFSEHYNHYHLHELEEETLDPAQFGETVREADEERALDDSEYDYNGGDEFEESEMLPGEESEEEEGEEEQAVEEQARAGAPSTGPRKRFERGRRGERDRGGRPGRGGRSMRMRREPRIIPQISDVLKEGQEVLIQIAKEPIGKKGARITSHIALPGRFLVYMPTVNHIGVSRKINSEEERQRLKRIVASERENGHGGFIVRTAAAGIKEDELRADIRFLKHLWHEIRTRAENSKSPALIYHDLNLVERVLRDQVTADFSQIWVDTQEEYERVVRFASRFQPALTRRVKLYTKDTPLFEQFGIQEEINKSLKSKVWLKSGGYIVINQTEALVAIDINTGKYVGKTARLEDTIVKTNCDAIKEIVRQIRLRDLGGIIVIDFIDMDERKNRQKVMGVLEEALKADRAPSKVLQFNDFGLVAITRKRVKQSLERTLGSACPYCEATGFVKSVSTVCNEIYSEMKKIRKHVETQDVTLRVNPDVAKELKTQNGKWISELEELLGASILVKSDSTLHQEKFDINF